MYVWSVPLPSVLSLSRNSILQLPGILYILMLLHELLYSVDNAEWRYFGVCGGYVLFHFLHFFDEKNSMCGGGWWEAIVCVVGECEMVTGDSACSGGGCEVERW